ncbi:MAG: polyphenol oxidase family protein [Thermoleophilia bacterium]
MENFENIEFFTGFARYVGKVARLDDFIEHASEKYHREDWGDLIIWELAQAPKKTRVYFTTRHGGVSGPPYDSLNLGFHVGDDPTSVSDNRKILAGFLGVDASRITSPSQRHTSEVSILSPDLIGTGSDSEESEYDPCDGLGTNIANAPLLFHYADCVPVVLMGGHWGEPAVTVLHAGRQGLMQGVISNGVRLMREQFGLELDSINAAIGPCIESCCYEVSEELAREFEERFGQDAVRSRFLDLRAAAVSELIGAGVYSDNISSLDICTSCDNDFYSYRRDGVTGRHGAIAWIEE